MLIRVSILLCALMLVLSIAGVGLATPLYTFNDYVQETRWVSTYGTGVAYNGWFQLDFPDSAGGTYSNGVFEYDDYINSIESLSITLHGHGDNSNGHGIDIYLSFDNKSSYEKVGSYDVPKNNPFTLTLDVKNNDLLCNGSDVGNLSNVSLQSFLGSDNFWVGYGCHFYHDKTEVNVAATPEPATMILLGSGLAGLAGIRRRYRKK